MVIQASGNAPYGPPRSIIHLVEGYRQRGYGTPFTSEVLVRAGVSESVVPRILASMRLLDLTDENDNPTQQFEDLKSARGDDEYKARLRSWLTSTYADVLKFADPVTDPPERIAEAFRGYKPDGQRQRMATLMLGLFAHAGIIDESKRPAAPRRPVTQRHTVLRGGRPRTPGSGSVTPRSEQLTPEVPDDLPPALVGLLRQIPADGRTWTTSRRQAFLAAFEGVLDFSVPIDDSPKAVNADDGEAKEENDS